MKNIIAIILVIIMLAFENKVEMFTDRSCKINPFKLDSLKTKFITNTNKTIDKPNTNKELCETFYTKKNLWVYNDIEFSSKKWQDFGSRYVETPNSGIVNICIDSIIYNLSSTFNIRIINQTNIKELIPEYEPFINKCKDKYIFQYLIKYAIIHKYGGLWLPKDTLVLKKFTIPDNIYYNNFIISLSENNNFYDNNVGVSDAIFASKQNNPILKQLLNDVLKQLDTFNYSTKFKNYFNIRFNEVANQGKLKYIPLNLTKEMNGRHFTFDTLFGVFNNNIVDYNKFSLLCLRTEYLDKFPKYSYINRMSDNQILMSNMFITSLVKYSFGKKMNLIHSGNIEGI
jgi:hypothetical protein